uniref:Uncharacterized protein n=1 Tax=Tetranychus urticae TaxID=32264 RepID=T1JSD8_TETUR
MNLSSKELESIEKIISLVQKKSDKEDEKAKFLAEFGLLKVGDNSRSQYSNEDAINQTNPDANINPDMLINSIPDETKIYHGIDVAARKLKRK